jgi:hypothetical protein
VSWGWWASRTRTSARDDPPSWLVPAGTGVVGACAGGCWRDRGQDGGVLPVRRPRVVHGAGVLADVLAAAVGDPEQEQVPGKRRGDRGDAVHAGDQQPRRRVKGR